MKVYEKVTVTEVVEKVSDLICNKCGDSCMVKDEDGMNVCINGKEFDFQSIWCSNLLAEGDYEFALCEKCLSDIFDTFEIPPDVDDGF